MRYLFVYKRGNIPQDKMQTLNEEWITWGKTINEKTGFRNAGGKTITKDSVTEYDGNFAGISIIEAGSLQEAVNLAQKNPGLKYGGIIKVLEEWKA